MNNVSNPQQDAASLTKFFSVVVKIITVIAGFASLFFLFGYTIILSFIDKVQLYGLTTFPQEFYKEAAIKFFVDMLEMYGNHPWYFSGMIVLFIPVVVVTCLIPITVKPKFETMLRFLAAACLLAVIIVTLRLDKFDFAEIFLFNISLPACFALLFYLAFNFHNFLEQSYSYYYLIILMFLGLFLSIPIAYGRSVFDVDVFPVKGIDYADSAKIESLVNLKNQINSNRATVLFFFMGHTTDKEIFFDWEGAVSPAKMLIVDRSLIKYLKVSKTGINKLRKILVELEQNTELVKKTDVQIEDKLPEVINTKINKALQGGVK